MLIRPMIIQSSMWSNIWPTNLIFLEANKAYLYYYQTCHHQFTTFIARHCFYWLATLVVRHCHYYYKTANLVLTTLLGWLKKMLNQNGKSHVMGHVMTLRIFGAPKCCVSGETSKKCSINLTLQVKLSWKIVMWEVT